ncbi:MAG: molybdenum cofactor guanylyltransferase MobA [Aeromonas sp.]
MSPSPLPVNSLPCSAVILAGGRGARMGGVDKGWQLLADKPLILHVLTRIAPQVDEVLISANRSVAAYAALAPVLMDAPATGAAEATTPAFAGPLAGMLAGLRAARHDWVLFVPCDCPALPHDLVARFTSALAAQPYQALIAHDGERLQPVIALLHRALADDLAAALAAGERRIDRWYAGIHHVWVDFSDVPSAFINLNDPEALAAYGARLTTRE